MCTKLRPQDLRWLTRGASKHKQAFQTRSQFSKWVFSIFFAKVKALSIFFIMFYISYRLFVQVSKNKLLHL